MKKSEAKRKKKARMLAVTFGVAALIVGGLTFAWYTSQDSVTNTFQANGTFKTVVVENFTPPLNWEPGATTDKVVQVTNTGTIDAYTRVTLTPTVTVTKKTGTKTPIGDSFSVGNTAYAEVDAAAIDAAATSGGFTEFSSSTLKDVITVPSGVTLYVKESTGDTDITSSATTETKKYEFLGYYEEGGTAYEIDIAIDNSALTAYGYTNDDGYITIETGTTTISSSLSFSLYQVEETTATDYNTYIKLNFYNPTEGYGYDTSNWCESEVEDNVYYYKHKLASGATTTPLLNSVTFRDDVDMTDITNIKVDIVVDSQSTQAIMEAGIDTFSTDDTYITKDSYTAIIVTGDQVWQSEQTTTAAANAA